MEFDFTVNVNDLTRGVSERGFGLALIYDTERNFDYTILTSASGLTDAVDEEGIEDSKLYKLVNKLFMQSPSPAEIAIFGSEGGGVAALNELNNEGNNDWFLLMCTDNEDELVKELSEWASANHKIYYSTVQNLDIFKELEYKNAMIGYHEDELDLVSEGLGAYLSVRDPGSAIAKFKNIQGSLPSRIKQTELNELHKNNGFSYIRKMGINHTSASQATDGSYLDVVLGSYFIKFRIEEALFMMAINRDKISYDNEDISSMAGAVRTVLNRAAEMKILLVEEGTPQYELTAKKREEMPANKIANRDYDGIRVKAQVAGAVEGGTVNIDLVI